MIKRMYGLLCLFLLCSFVGKALDINRKYGKIGKEELDLKVYTPDSSAQAVYLFDKGSSDIVYDRQKGFMMLYKRHFRIKILTQEGADEFGNISMLLRKYHGRDEDVNRLKGCTYNLEGGKIIKNKVGHSDLFTEEVNKYRDRLKVAFPNVKPGSVVELYLEIYSDFFTQFRVWSFQHSAPVMSSEFTAEIPEYFHYNLTQKGFVPLKKNIRNSKPVSINITQGTGGNGFRQGTLEYTANCYKFAAQNVPAFIEEPYMTSVRNYLGQMVFELASIRWPNEPVKNFTTTWKAIGKELLKSSDFGGQITNNFTKEVALQLVQGMKGDKEKAAALYYFVQGKFKWNNYYGLYPNPSVRKLYKEQVGNEASINLLLVQMLKNVGLNAHPVVLSTRGNGILFPSHPSADQLNYVLAGLNIDGKVVLMDASIKNLSFGMLPFKCLNGNGYMLSNQGVVGVKLGEGASSMEVKMAQLTLKEDGSLCGSFSNKYIGHAAYQMRSDIAEEGSEEEYIQKQKEKDHEMVHEEWSFDNEGNLNMPLTEKMKFKIDHYGDVAGDHIYFKPIMMTDLKENPFKLEERNYPVDFGYRFSHTFVARTQLPAGYEVEELPQSAKVSLPNKSGSFLFSINKIGNELVVNCRYNVRKSVFLSTEYTLLKQFYDLMINKLSEQVVLKKI